MIIIVCNNKKIENDFALFYVINFKLSAHLLHFCNSIFSRLVAYFGCGNFLKKKSNCEELLKCLLKNHNLESFFLNQTLFL